MWSRFTYIPAAKLELTGQSSDQQPTTHTKKLSIKSLRSIYFPQAGDNVIGIIVKKGPESYGVDINCGQPAFLDSVEFNGATKRNKPNLKVGDAIFTKVESVNKFLAPVLTCKSKHCKKDWTSGESTYGQLKDGIVHTLSPGLNEYLRQEKTLFASIKKYVTFEVALGANDRVFIHTANSQNQVLLGNLLQDMEKLSPEEIRAAVEAIAPRFVKE